MTEPKHDLARLRGNKFKIGKASVAMPQVKFQNTKPQQSVFLGFALLKRNVSPISPVFPNPENIEKTKCGWASGFWIEKYGA